MTEWIEKKLGDLVTHKKGYAFKSDLFGDEGDIVVKVSNTTDNSIDIRSCSKIKNEIAQQFNEYRLKEKDIIIATVGSWPDNPKSIVGKVIRVPQEADNALLNQNTVRLRADETNLQHFIYYRLKCKDFSDYLINGAQGSANQASITLDDIFNFQIKIPDSKELHSIINVLKSLENKIILFNRQNKTLEAMAETLFRQWFVEEAEEGWEKKRLGDYIEIKHGFAFKGDHITTEETDKLLLTPGNFKIGGGFNFDKCRYYNDTDFPGTYILEEGNLIVTMTDLSQEGDTLGYPAFVPSIKDKYILHNQRIGKVLFKENHANKKLFFYWLMRGADYRHYVLGSATGTTVRHTSPSTICDYEISMPNIAKLETFEGQIKMLQEKETFNHIQIHTLTRLRNTLLPKLMSGEVRVKLEQQEACI